MTCLGPAPKLNRFFRLLVFSAFALWLPLASTATWAAEAKNSTAESGLNPILTYISSGWDTLTRSMTDCQTVVDPKLTEASILYLPADFPSPPAVQELQKRCKVDVQPLLRRQDAGTD
jgi:alpha,alpha-trehalase